MSGLLVFVAIAIVLVIMSLGIWKSSMPENDKVLTLILILSVFSLITIIHEAKRPNLSSIKGGYTNVSISSSFFNYKQFEPVNENCSAKVFREIYSSHSNMQNTLNTISRNQSSFLLIRPNDDYAISEILQTLSSSQMKSRRPVLYINFQNELFLKENWTQFLGDFHENALLHELWKFREQNRLPWLIFDNFAIEPEFHDGHLAHLTTLIYEDFAGDVILKPADELTFALVKSGENFHNSDEGIAKRAEIVNLGKGYNNTLEAIESHLEKCSIQIERSVISECQKIIGTSQKTLDLILAKNSSGINENHVRILPLKNYSYFRLFEINRKWN